jgi:hypothetical protein
MADWINTEDLPESYYPSGVKRIYTATTQNGRGSIVMKFGEDTTTEAYEESDRIVTEPTELQTIDNKLELVGLLSNEVARYKERLINSAIDDFNNDVIVPQISTSSVLSQMKTSNDLKSKENDREIIKLKADVEYYKTDIQIKLKDLELKEKANLLAETQLYMQGQLYEQNERIIKQNITLSKNVYNLKSVTSKGVEDQIATNKELVENLTKKNEHLDYLKDGLPNLKDSTGQIIKPRESESKNNAEQHIYKNDVNTYNHRDNTLSTLNYLNGVAGLGGSADSSENTELLSILDKLAIIDYSKFNENNKKLFGGM